MLVEGMGFVVTLFVVGPAFDDESHVEKTLEEEVHRAKDMTKYGSDRI